MSCEYLRDDDGFEFAHAGDYDRYLFERRVARQVQLEMDTTCNGILEYLGISDSKELDNFTAADGAKLQELEDKMTKLILDICRRKKA